MNPAFPGSMTAGSHYAAKFSDEYLPGKTDKRIRFAMPRSSYPPVFTQPSCDSSKAPFLTNTSNTGLIRSKPFFTVTGIRRTYKDSSVCHCIAKPGNYSAQLMDSTVYMLFPACFISLALHRYFNTDRIHQKFCFINIDGSSVTSAGFTGNKKPV